MFELVEGCWDTSPTGMTSDDGPVLMDGEEIHGSWFKTHFGAAVTEVKDGQTIHVRDDMSLL